MSGIYHPSNYICLLCGWQGQPRELARDPDGTQLFCPGCNQPASYLMDLSDTPEEHLACRHGTYIYTLETKRAELRIKPTSELRKIIRQFNKILSAEESTRS